MKKNDIGAFNAKTHFSELLAAVSHGSEFTITLRGTKVAKLIPFSQEEKENTPEGAIRAIRKLRSGLKLGKKLKLSEMRAEGRK